MSSTRREKVSINGGQNNLNRHVNSHRFRTPYFSQLESAEVLKISFKSDPGKMVSV